MISHYEETVFVVYPTPTQWLFLARCCAGHFVEIKSIRIWLLVSECNNPLFMYKFHFQKLVPSPCVGHRLNSHLFTHLSNKVLKLRMRSRGFSAYHLGTKTDMETHDYIINAEENNQ